MAALPLSFESKAVLCFPKLPLNLWDLHAPTLGLSLKTSQEHGWDIYGLLRSWWCLEDCKNTPHAERRAFARHPNRQTYTSGQVQARNQLVSHCRLQQGHPAVGRVTSTQERHRPFCIIPFFGNSNFPMSSEISAFRGVAAGWRYVTKHFAALALDPQGPVAHCGWTVPLGLSMCISLM